MTLITLENRSIRSIRELEADRNTYRNNYSAMLDRHGEEFPLLLTMPASAMDGGATAWLCERLGPVTEGWRVVPEWPSHGEDTFMFRECDRQTALLFRLTF